jgi:hypothetical protein
MSAFKWKPVTQMPNRWMIAAPMIATPNQTERESQQTEVEP